MMAHKMNARQIELPTAARALRDMEHAWVVRVGQLLDLLELRLRLESVRADQLLVLDAIQYTCRHT